MIILKNNIISYNILRELFQFAGLQFKHTDNIHKFLNILKKTELPLVSVFICIW